MFGALGYKFGWRKMQVIGWIFFLAGFLFLALPFVQGFTQEAWRRLFDDLSTGLLLLSIGLGGIIAIPHLRRSATLFKAALASPLGNVPMVANQPVSDSSPIVSPITIRRRIRWPAALAWYTAFFLVTTLVLAGLIVGDELLREHLAGAPPEKSSVTILIVVALALTCGLAVLIAVFMLPWRQQQMLITDEGIIQVQSGRRSAVAWKEARVFALIEGGRRPSSSATHILASGRHGVRWTHRSRTRWYSITTPTTSDDEYQRQMDALLSYAAARTGLPLLDMR
jgi:hypothetical protein